jgi:hypothetical protein
MKINFVGGAKDPYCPTRSARQNPMAVLLHNNHLDVPRKLEFDKIYNISDCERKKMTYPRLFMHQFSNLSNVIRTFTTLPRSFSTDVLSRTAEGFDTKRYIQSMNKSILSKNITSSRRVTSTLAQQEKNIMWMRIVRRAVMYISCVSYGFIFENPKSPAPSYGTYMKQSWISPDPV